MSWFSRLGSLLGGSSAASGPQSRQIARERLSIILAHQRGANLLSEGQMQRLQQEVLESVKVGGLPPPLLSFFYRAPTPAFSLTFFDGLLHFPFVPLSEIHRSGRY